MMIFLKKLHKWVGLLIGIQVFLWLMSGLMISLLDPAKVSGAEWTRTAVTAAPPSFHNLLEPVELSDEMTRGALGIELKTIRGTAVYQITRVESVSLVNATTGVPIKTRQRDAEKLALQDFAGDGEIISIESSVAPDLETRNHSGPYWRVNFSDAASTSYYISQSTGKILERRNSYWRTRDFFWMLHIMDYSGREDFNNSLIILIALIAVWLGISGFLLLFYTFNRHDFWFLNVTGKHDEATITLIEPSRTRPQQVRLRIGSNLFLALANHDINLPSICGGGGECGKCKVRYDSADLPEPGTIENSLIPRRQRERGVRLACQQEVQTNITLHLPDGSLAAKEVSATEPA